MGQPRRLTGVLRELLGGTTVRSMAAEYGPPPAVHYAVELAGLDDAALLAGPQRRAPRRTGAILARVSLRP